MVFPNVLANPTLELHDGTGALIASNDNWQNYDNRRDYHQRPGQGYSKQRACSEAAKRICDHRRPATGQLHRDRAWQEHHSALRWWKCTIWISKC